MNTTTPGMRAYQLCASHRSTGAFRAISATTGFSDPEGNGLERYRAIAAETARTDKKICLNSIGLYISRLQAFPQGSLWRERPPIGGRPCTPGVQLETGARDARATKRWGRSRHSLPSGSALKRARNLT